MPKLNPNVDAAKGFDAIPGTWLSMIPQFVTLGGKEGKTKPGLEVGSCKVAKTGAQAEMWKVIAQVQEDPEHPEAPVGQIAYENLVWDGGAGESRIYALLKAQGHPIEAWKKSTTPIDITPELIFNRPFAFKLKVRNYEKDGEAREGLEADGFMPFFPPTHPRGPAPAASAAPKKDGGGAGATSFGFGANAPPAAGGGAPPAAKPGTTKKLWS